MMLVFRDMIMHEEANSGLRTVSSKDWCSQVGLGLLRRYSQQCSRSQGKGSRGRAAEGGKNTHRCKGTPTKGPPWKLECAQFGETVRVVLRGGGSLKCHFKLIDAASAAGECEANTDLCWNRIQELYDVPVDSFKPKN